MAEPVEQDNMLIEWDVGIAMDDGLVVRADVFRPLAHGKMARSCSLMVPMPRGWRFRRAIRAPGRTWSPAIRTSRPDRPTNIRTGRWSIPEKWVPHGYVCVRVDSRGTGRSPGYVDHFSPRETRDFYQCIEWAGVQPWSNGKVGPERHFLLRASTSGMSPRSSRRI